MAATIQRIGRLGSFKVFQVESWCVPKAALFSSQAEEPTKTAKKTKAAGKTAEVPDDRATLLAYKTQVAFPVRLSNLGVFPTPSLDVTELLATTNTPTVTVTADSEAAVREAEATSLLEVDSAHVGSDTAPPVVDKRLTSEQLTASTTDNAATTKPASSEISDPAAAGSSSSESDSDSDSDSDSGSDSDSEKEKSEVKAEQITTLKDLPESTKNDETESRSTASDVKDEVEKEISPEAKATSAMEVSQETVHATAAHTHSDLIEPEKNPPSAPRDDPISFEVAQVDADHVLEGDEAKSMTATSPTAVSVDGTDDAASPVENTHEKVESAPVVAEVETTQEKVEPAPVLAEEESTKEKVEPAPVLAEEESTQEKVEPVPVLAEEESTQGKVEPASVMAEGESTQEVVDPAAVTAEGESTQEVVDPAPVTAEGESTQEMVDPAPVIVEEESNRDMVDAAPVIAEEELQGKSPVGAPEETAAAAPPEPEEPFDNSTYKNLQHHSYTPYTFADLDLEMAKYRLPQPSSGRPSPRH